MRLMRRYSSRERREDRRDRDRHSLDVGMRRRRDEEVFGIGC